MTNTYPAHNNESAPEYMPSVEDCAKQGRPFIQIPYEKDTALQQMLLFFGAEYDNPVSVHRMRQLAYYFDYRYYQLHGDQLTNLSYKGYSSGIHNDKIEVELEDSPLVKEVTWESQQARDAYTDQGSHLSLIEDDLLAFFEQVHEETYEVSTEDLKTFAKNTPAFRDAAFGNVIEFTDETVASMDSYDF